jgi:hypothetical protein
VASDDNYPNSSDGVAAKEPKERKANHFGLASLFTRWVKAGLAQKPFSLRSLRLFVAIPFSFLS